MTRIYAGVAIRPGRCRRNFKPRAKAINTVATVAVAVMATTSTSEMEAVTRMERSRIGINRAVNTTTIIGTTIITVTR
jgi:hypothetical protein